MKRLLLFLALAIQCWAVPALVQATSQNANSTTTNTQVFGSSVTANHLIVVGCAVDHPTSGTSLPTITASDDKGNTYIPISAPSGSNITWLQMFYAIATTGGASFQVTCTSGISGYVGLAMAEYSGLKATAPDVFDQESEGANLGGSPASTRYCVSTSTANQVLVAVGFYRPNLGGALTWTAGTGYTIETSTTSGNSVELEDNIVSSTGCYNATVSASSAFGSLGMVTNMATFVASGDTIPTKRLVQGISAGCSGGATTCTASFITLPKVGNLVVATCGEYVSGSAPTLTITDNQSNSYTPAPALFGANEAFVANYYTVVTTSSGTFTATCTSSTSVHTPVLSLVEISGFTILDQTATSTPVFASSITSNSLTTTKASEVLVACMLYPANTPHIFTPGSGFTMVALTNGNLTENNTMNCEYQIVSSTGTYSATMTTNDNTGYKNIVLESYNGAGGGGSSGVGPPVIWIQ